VPDLAGIHAKLAFTCAYEQDHLPALDPSAEKLYRYARWLRKNQIEKEDPLRYPQMERYYRIATAHGHYKANLDLREMIGLGHAYEVEKGIIDDSGKLMVMHCVTTQKYQLKLANGVVYDIPVVTRYTNDAMGDLANMGLHRHQAGAAPAGGRTEPQQHARGDYSQLFSKKDEA
jgi:hypothetical protein